MQFQLKFFFHSPVLGQVDIFADQATFGLVDSRELKKIDLWYQDSTIWRFVDPTSKFFIARVYYPYNFGHLIFLRNGPHPCQGLVADYM